MLDGVNVQVTTHQSAAPATLPLPDGPASVRKPIEGSKLEAIGTVISAPPFASRDLYVFVAAGMKECSSATLFYRVGEGREQQVNVNQYPCEFTARVNDMKAPIDWRVQLRTTK